MQPITAYSVAVALVAFFLWVIVKARDWRAEGPALTACGNPSSPRPRTCLPRGAGTGRARRECRVFRQGAAGGYLRRGAPISTGPNGWPPGTRSTAKHVDFLLVKESDLAPLAGIELDDSLPRGRGPPAARRLCRLSLRRCRPAVAARARTKILQHRRRAQDESDRGSIAADLSGTAFGTSLPRSYGATSAGRPFGLAESYPSGSATAGF